MPAPLGLPLCSVAGKAHLKWQHYQVKELCSQQLPVSKLPQQLSLQEGPQDFSVTATSKGLYEHTVHSAAAGAQSLMNARDLSLRCQYDSEKDLL